MVYNPVIAHGYPVPKREEEPTQSGLELSTDLLVSLSHANWANNMEAHCFCEVLCQLSCLSSRRPHALYGISS